MPIPGMSVVADLCTGCRICARDCPVDVISMVPTAPGSRYKEIAVIHDDCLVYCATGTDVVTTIVGGRVLMEDRNVLSVSQREVLTEAARRAEKIAGRWRAASATSV